MTYFCTLSQVEQALDPVAVEELFVAPGLCCVNFEISEIKLQNCTFVGKFRLIGCRASLILAIKKNVILGPKNFWVLSFILIEFGLLSTPLLGISKITRYLFN